MSGLTVVILTKNEEKNIVDVIVNSQQVSDNILIVDSGSTDRTVELAEKSGAKVFYRAWDNDFAAQRNYALGFVNTDWVLYLDADERINKELVASIRSAVKKNLYEQYSIKRKSVAFGKEFNYGVLGPDYVYRMFKTPRVKWVNKVHERPECADKKVVLNGYAKHYTYDSWEQYLNKFNQYTSLWAKDAYEKGKRTTLYKAFIHAIGAFLKMTFMKKGILDGSLGFYLCCNHFSYTLMKYLKLIELQNKKVDIR